MQSSQTAMSTRMSLAILVVVVVVVLLQATTAPAPVDSIKVGGENNASATTATTTGPRPGGHNSVSLPFELDLVSGRAIIPGLYDSLGGVITPIRGKQQFQRLVLGLGEEVEATGEPAAGGEEAWPRGLAERQTVSLVQFYMATCPDCQGFSPYFKRFARDIGPHWRKLVRIFVVNCNDFTNIHLCQEENPKLVVPMVRWYAFPVLQRDAILADAAAPTTSRQFNFSRSLLSVGHRGFIEKQRRDLISLRRATIRFVQLMLAELRQATTGGPNRRDLFDLLPTRWHLIAGQLGGASGRPERRDASPTNLSQFLGDLNGRTQRCLGELGPAESTSIRHFIVFEPTGSYIGRTLAADWSNLTCAADDQRRSAAQVVLLHQTTDLSLVRQLKIGWPNSTGEKNLPVPLLVSLNVTVTRGVGAPLGALDDLKFSLLASNRSLAGQLARTRRYSHAQAQRPERLQQRASLQRFYTRSQPFRYASSMTSGGKNVHKREAPNKVQQQHQQKLKAQAEAEHVNWTPESVFPGEEATRYQFNELLARELRQEAWPGGRAHPGELNVTRPPGVRAIPPREDDLTLLLLTDYYKSLDEIVHADLLAKGELDYYQLVASSCMLHELIKHFPYQGNVYAPDRVNQGLDGYYKPFKSIARQYLHLVRELQIGELERRLNVGKLTISCAPKPARRPLVSGGGSSSSSSGKHNLLLLSSSSSSWSAKNTAKASVTDGDGTPSGTTNDDLESSAVVDRQLDELRIPIGQLEASMAQIREKYDTGLPASKHFGWKYCLGASSYLRGHTCSLWLLFHTLTVHEYLEKQRSLAEAAAEHSPLDNAADRFENEKLVGAAATAAAATAATAAAVAPNTSSSSNANSSTLTTTSIRRDKRHQLLEATTSTPTWRNLASSSPASNSSERRFVGGAVASSANEPTAGENRQPNQMTQQPAATSATDGEPDRQQPPRNLILAGASTPAKQLEPPQDGPGVADGGGDGGGGGEEYKFQIDYSRPPRATSKLRGRPCDPRSPEEAFLGAKSSELFLEETQNVVVNIINFVRFYLPCTNCAAHFSCMVEHSSGLNLDVDDTHHLGDMNSNSGGLNNRIKGTPSRADDSHLLWLWEAHNRVNERTRGTHSEDPTRPKHIFPVYEACPQCYLVEPAANSTFAEMRFNRRELVKFIVARYRRSAILNNKINIEDLYRKT